MGLSTYDKYRYLAAVLSYATDYDYGCIGGWQNGTAYGAIWGGHSICEGYSKGFMVLCQQADLWCVCIEGVVDGTAHMWNMVQLDTGLCHVDVTWADGQGDPGSELWLANFMQTEEEAAAQRIISGQPIDVFVEQFQ